MKPRHFKIRTAQSGLEEFPRIRKSPQVEKNTINPIGQSQQILNNDDEAQYRDFFKMFKAIMDKDKSSRVQPEHYYKTEMQPRDREIIIEPPAIFKDFIEEKQLKRWIASVFKTVCSAAFHYYTTKQVNFEQAKIYCSENIFKNIAYVGKHYYLSPKQFQIIDRHVERKVLSYLGTKYPLTDSTNINKKIEEVIHQVDNIQSLENNYLSSTTIQFEYRDDGNYNDIIMKIMNELMESLNQEMQQEVTTYTQFVQFMTNVFEKVMDQDWVRKNDKDLLSSLKLSNTKSSTGSPTKVEPKPQNQNVEEQKEFLRKRNEEKEKYRATVKEYTNYLIGRKIPQNTHKYTEKEIQSKNMSIKNPTILRILTKWCEQLWQKYTQVGYYTSRSDSVKILKGGNVNSLLDWMRKDIDARLTIQKQEIIKFTAQIAENNYQMQSKILKMELGFQDYDYVQQLQKICGKFSLKVVKNVHSYIIAYLNRLIHGLIGVAKDFHSQHNLGTYSFWSSPPNLLTFRTGDLMRCKISSKEKQIVRIYKQLQRLTKQNPQKFRIIRIKNRLKKETNDILINFKFNNKIICQVQLAVKGGYTTDFIKCSNNFHHYLYELQRSNFGPLIQLCSIWNNLDIRFDTYQDLMEQQKNSHKPVDHICKKLNKKTVMKVYKRPFMCSECSAAFFHNNYLKSHLKCANCEYYFCSNCQIDKKPDNVAIQQLITDQSLRTITNQKIDKNQALPKLGMCIFLETKIPKPQFFQIITSEKTKKNYLIGKKNGQIYEIDNIQTSKDKKEFRRRHLIFQVTEEGYSKFVDLTDQEIKIHLVTKTIKSNFKKQKQSISLMGQEFNTEACKQILSVGTKYQKENVKNLFLTDNVLTELPINPEDYPNLSWLTLSRNEGMSLAGISRLPKLKNLIFVAGGLQSIPQEFYNVVSLQEITLNENQISKIEDKIANFKRLKVLQMDRNALTELPNQLGLCKSLKELKVQTNYLTQLPEELFSLQNLEVFMLNSNSITKLSNSISKLTKLKHLEVAQNYGLAALPESIVRCSNLQKLNISNTNISQLPSNFAGLSNLTELSLSSTQIKQLPHDLYCLSKLQKLQLKGLNLENLKVVGSLKALTSLNLSNCCLTQLPQQLIELSQLETLDLSCNQITYFSHDIFSRMSKIHKLQLQQNSLTEFPDLQKQKNLIQLDLSNNTITEIPNQRLQSCVNLQKLLMVSNRLTHIPYCLKNFNKLLFLDLKQNQLTHLFQPQHEEEINSLPQPIWPKLSQLLLNINRLTYLPPYLFMNSNIAEFYFSDNEINVLPSLIGNIKKLRQLQANNNKITELPKQLCPLQNLIGIYMSFNSIKVVPKFIEKMSKLQAFYLDNNDIETIECIDWLLEKEYTITLGQLPSLAYKFKYGKDRYQEQPAEYGGNEQKPAEQEGVQQNEDPPAADQQVNNVENDSYQETQEIT